MDVMQGMLNMAKQATVVLDEKLEAFVGNSIANGDYANESAVIEAGLRRLQDDAEKLEALRAALQEGEDSGEPSEFDFDAFLSDKRRKRMEKQG
jgi:antitoxin ParD1/3/4